MIKQKYHTNVKIYVNGDLRSSRPNIITAHGLQAWRDRGLGVHLALGTGERPPSLDISSLANQTASTEGVWISHENSREGGVITGRSTIMFNFPDETSGTIYRELGLYDDNDLAIHTYQVMRNDEGEVGIVVARGERISIEYEITLSLPERSEIPLHIFDQEVTATHTVRAANHIHKPLKYGTAANSVYGYPEPKEMPDVGEAIPSTGSLSTSLKGLTSDDVKAVPDSTWYGKGISLIEYSRNNSSAIAGTWFFEPALVWPSEDYYIDFGGGVSNEHN